MPIQPFLAMTAAEMRNASSFPEKTAWMACHFSPYGTGLSNLPASLPPDSLLILNDRTPICGHDPQRIAEQLEECIGSLGCCGLLLDFQRSGSQELGHLIQHLADTLPCPVIVSDLYAEAENCPVFLSPVPSSVSLKEHIAPWTGRDIWLEIALEGEVIDLTEKGAQVTPLPHPDQDWQGFSEKNLHCHYHITLEEDSAKFTLWRTREDWDQLLEEAESIGIPAAVGLYQELHTFPRNTM